MAYAIQTEEEHSLASAKRQNLVNGKHLYRLLLRFAYIHLVWLIGIYRAAAARDRVEGLISRGVGQRDITVAIDMYLAAKKEDCGLCRADANLMRGTWSGPKLQIQSALEPPNEVQVYPSLNLKQTLITGFSWHSRSLRCFLFQPRFS
jgi:hypothetical protein